jgi:cytochrome c oxidase assembly protein subunit 11
MTSPAGKKRITAGATLAIVAVMVTLVGFSVPLYRLFCGATGYNGTTQRATVAPTNEVANRTITVRFNATVAPGLAWQFRPEKVAVDVHPGETMIAHFRAVNYSGKPMTGTATFNVTPSKAGLYFDKLQCFCFSAQHLEPGQSADLPVQFFVDPDIVNDPNTTDVDTITLSYTMFRAKDDSDEPLRSSALSSTPSVN